MPAKRSVSGSPRKRTASAKARAVEAEEDAVARFSGTKITTDQGDELADQGKQPPFKWTPEEDKFDGTWEFGGWIGALGIPIFSHLLIYYAFIIIVAYDGQWVYPGHPAMKGENFFAAFKKHFVANCMPTTRAFALYLGFLVFEWAMAAMPIGITLLGKFIPSEGGYRHPYRCNAVQSWYVLLSLVLGLWYFNIWSISEVARNYGAYLTSAIIVGNAVSVFIFFDGLRRGRAVRMSGNWLYDFFMGSCLNPKLPGGVDFKMIAELRISWGYLFLITLSHTIQMYEDQGYVTPSMWLVLYGHFLYCNACHKGEECVPSCWDIFHEKFGWMLIFWNLAGVPVFYGIQALYVMRVQPKYVLPTWGIVAVAIVVSLAYWIWDTSLSQKNRFRMMRDGVPERILTRKTFPQLPWGYLGADAKTITGKTVKGQAREILVGGWYQYARKIPYTVDSVMAFCWGASCGFNHFVPFLYWTFHFLMLLHRVTRDEHQMAAKYGKLWDEYVDKVPYRFIPFVY